MVKMADIREQLGRLLANQISLAEFSKWFVPNTWNAHLDSAQDAQEFAEAIDDLLVESDGDSPELRESLKEVFFAYQASPFSVSSYGDSLPILESNAINELVEV